MANNFNEKCGGSVALGPFTPGKIRLKAVIWHACPFYERIRQEVSLQYGPLTMQQVNPKEKEFLQVVPEIDGVFLRKKQNVHFGTYLAQFLNENITTSLQSIRNRSAFDTKDGVSWRGFINRVKEAAASENRRKKKDKDSNKNPTKWQDLLPAFMRLDNIEFLPDYGLSLAVDRQLYPYVDIKLDGYKVVESTWLGQHQTFINVGSIYDSKTLPFQEYDLREREFNDFDAVAMAFRAKWKYEYLDIGSAEHYKNLFEATTNDKGRFITFDKSAVWRILAPTLIGTELYTDPINYMLARGISDTKEFRGPFKKSNNVYLAYRINPGLHWGLIKRFFTVPGQSYSISVIKMAEQDYKSASTQHIYAMSDEFAWLDPHRANELSRCAGFNQDGKFEQAKYDESRKNHIIKYNLANQAYILIRLQDDVVDLAENGSSELCSLYLLICENMSPVLLRDFTWEIDCNDVVQEDTGDSAEPTEEDCANKTTMRLKFQETRKVKNKKQTTTPARKTKAFEVASCDFVGSGSSLLSQKHLRIDISYLKGRLVIKFSGYEDRTWVVSNTIAVPNLVSSLPDGNSVSNEYDIVTKTLPFKFTLSPISIYGGNQKVAINYSPILFESSAVIDHKDLNMQGPAEFSEVQLLFQDKSSERQINKSEVAPEFTQNYAINYTEKTGKISSDSMYFNYKKIWPYHASQDAEYRGARMAVRAGECFTNLGSNTEYNKFFRCSVRLDAGDVFLPFIDQVSTEASKENTYLKNGDTPVASILRMVVPTKGIAWSKQALDVSNYVLNFSDDWSEENFKKISHSGSISFYIQQSNDTEHNFVANTLLSLGDKAFYIQVSAWWEFNQKIGTGEESQISAQSYLQNQQEDAILFTGVCYGGKYSVENNMQTLNCKIEDYSKILKDQKFFNGPFFDSMADVFAMKEILDLAGFRDGGVEGSAGYKRATHAPGAFLREVCDNYGAQKNSAFNEFYFNGERIKVRNYVLPGAFDILQSAKFKPKDDQTYWEWIDKMATVSSKVAYFDRLGVFRYENMPFDDYLFQIRNKNQSAEDAERQSLEAVLRIAGKNCFYASPLDAFNNDIKSNQTGSNQTRDDVVPPLQGPNIEKDNQIRSLPCSSTDVFSMATGLIIQSYTFERDVGSIQNEIKVISNTPNGELLIAGDLNYESLYDPNSVGFLGYRKPWIQIDPIFASEITVKEMINHYTKFYIPPLRISFKVLGRNKLKVLDAISFLGLGTKSTQRQPLIITALKNNIDASKNVWYQDIEALWLFSGKRVVFGTTVTYSIGLDGSISSQ